MIGRDKNQLSLLRVFIASPGDLNEERIKFREIIEEVNRIKATPLNIYLHPAGWEDTLPGKGRPQKLINQDVESCDLFVLLLWKRWGTPTGEYSSGTEEEFELARLLNEKQQGKPHIFLYFKSLPKDMLADPGPQLRQVLEFRTKIEQERSFFYCPFDSFEDWERKFREHICRWIDNQPPLDNPLKQIEFPPDVELRIHELEEKLRNVAETNDISESKLAHTAATLGIKALDAAREGRFTEAQSLFASSLATYEHRDTINAYVLLMEDLGKADLIEERFKHRKEQESPQDIAVAFANLGNYHARHGNLDKAAENYSRALDLITGQRAFQFYSCFISFSGSDEHFARKLYADLQAQGIRCWFAPEDLKIGDVLRPEIERSIRVYDKLIIILSEHSVRSQWVEQEVESALSKEREERHTILFPIRLDDAVMTTISGWPALIRNTRNIGDFRQWRTDGGYQEAFEKLLHALKSDER